MKNSWKKTIAIFIITAITSLMMPVAALAVDDIAKFSCPLIDKPEQTKHLIITILEEEIGSSESIVSAEASSIFCYRVTDCTTADGVKTCESKYAADCNPLEKPDRICQRVQVISALSGAALLYFYIGLIYRWAAGVIGIVSVLYMVWGGIQIATAGDNTGKIDEAKTKIFQSIAGLVLLFLSAVILYTINPNFFTA